MKDPSGFLERKPKRLPLKSTLYEQLWRGWLPEAQFVPLDVIPDFHAAYQRTYIERDARMLADVSDWKIFGRFIRLAAALTAQEVNYSELGRELGLTPQTSRRWLDVLHSTFQWFEAPAYSGNAVKRISGKPKGFVADTGAACFAQAISSPHALGGYPMWGDLSSPRWMIAVRSPSATTPCRGTWEDKVSLSRFMIWSLTGEPTVETAR